ncbi:MAG TPA: BadF/BadG/BcrA/BcrD ATPase family protein [bacterium]|nr:BadF/BadG/BcrA/BcrD ATPase family protein [bacterium]
MSARTIVLGIDGGASSTTCVVAGADGRVLGVGRGGPIDHLYRADGRRRTSRALKEAIGAARRAARLGRGERVAAVAAGLTGLEPQSAASRHAVRIISRLLPARIVRATWDAEIAFLGAGGGRPGVMVIAGTGSVALGRSAAGMTARAGGYGFLIDDAGGGVSIGAAGLRAVLGEADGRGPVTALSAMIARRLGDWPAIRARVYGEGGGRPLLASLAPLVNDAARRGDGVARAILADAGRSLGALALAVARRLGMRGRSFDLYLVGGIFEMGPAVIGPLRRAVRDGAPRCRIRRPRFPPVVGAALMALEAAGVAVTPAVLRNLRGTDTASSARRRQR